MKQPELIPAEMKCEIVRPEPPRPDMYIIIAYMRGRWYIPRFAERLYDNGDRAMRDVERFAGDTCSPYSHFKVVKIPGT